MCDLLPFPTVWGLLTGNSFLNYAIKESNSQIGLSRLFHVLTDAGMNDLLELSVLDLQYIEEDLRSGSTSVPSFCLSL